MVDGVWMWVVPFSMYIYTLFGALILTHYIYVSNTIFILFILGKQHLLNLRAVTQKEQNQLPLKSQRVKMIQKMMIDIILKEDFFPASDHLGNPISQ